MNGHTRQFLGDAWSIGLIYGAILAAAFGVGVAAGLGWRVAC